MSEPPKLTCHVLDTGFCWASEHHLIRGGRRQRIACHSLVALLRHPQKGWFLWDTGYSPFMLEVTRRFPYRLYRWITPMVLRPELAAVAQLDRFGITPRDIKQVIISHFHADHLSGLKDFPTAELIASRSAFESVMGLSGWKALRRGFVPALLPDDFSRRVTLLGDPTGSPLDPLGPTLDLFGDGSALVVMLPGHARGQIGLLVQTEGGPLFFVADSCWMSEGFRQNRPPHWIAGAITDNKAEMLTTLRGLHDYSHAHPDVALLPTHCPEVYRKYVQGAAE